MGLGLAARPVGDAYRDKTGPMLLPPDIDKGGLASSLDPRQQLASGQDLSSPAVLQEADYGLHTHPNATSPAALR